MNSASVSQYFSHIYVERDARQFVGVNITNKQQYKQRLGGCTVDGAGTIKLTLKAGNALDLLPYADQAPYNSRVYEHGPFCLRDTRVGVLQDINEWANGTDARCVFWLNGWAGTGKTTIARTVAHKYDHEERLGASFFFSRGGGAGHAGKFFTSIAVQLAEKLPCVKSHICDAVTPHNKIASQTQSDQWHRLVLQPLSKLGRGFPHPSLLLVVDALDECSNDEDVEAIVQLLAEARSLTTVRLRVFLTSRPEIPIRLGFRRTQDTDHQDFVLHVPSFDQQ
jgi:NACHT domain